MSLSSPLASSPAESDRSAAPANNRFANASRNPFSESSSIAPSVKDKMKLASSPPPPASLTSPRYTFYSPSELPPLETISRLVSAFARGNSPLMYMLAEYEAMELISAVYSPTTRPTISQLCELLAIAAVGAQYEDVGSSTTTALFRSAKWYLDIEYARDGDMLRKMRVSMLVGLFLIFEKSFFALDYLDQAICLARTIGINGAIRCEPYSEREWASWRRVWRSLIYLDGWVAATVGTMPKISHGEDPIFSEGYRTCTNDLDAYLHSELVKLGILMGIITKDVYAPAVADLASMAECSKRLKHWHSSLPESLRLSQAVSGNDPKQRSAVLLTHCSYLNCVILMCRKTLLEQCTEATSPAINGNGDGNANNGVADEYAQMCVSAGRQLATVVGILYLEGRLVRRCWLAIQSAYTSGLIACLCLSTRRCHDPLSAVTNSQDDELLTKCLEALDFCAPHDLVARRCLDILASIRRTIISLCPSFSKKPPSKRSRPTPHHEFPKYSYSLAAHTDPVTQYIVAQLRNPFGTETHVFLGPHPVSKAFPENWRFLPPEPPRNLEGYRSPPVTRMLTPAPSPPIAPPTPPSAVRRRGAPLRSREELEAFLGRVA